MSGRARAHFDRPERESACFGGEMLERERGDLATAGRSVWIGVRHTQAIPAVLAPHRPLVALGAITKR